MRIYLDNAATTPVLKEVVDEMTEVLKDNFGNPSSIHAEGRKARSVIENARKCVANHLNCSLGEVFFTSCGTESNNMVLKNAVRDLGVQRIVSSPLEHHCILHSLESLKNQDAVEVEWVDLKADGSIDYEHLNSLLHESEKKTLVSLMHANNEIGHLLDLHKVAEICQENGAYFHSDTVQTIGYYKIDLSKIPLHFLSGSAHKFHGPKGVGFVYINSANMLKPFIDGGSQERNMRGGTENIAGIAGLAKALDLAYNNLEEKRKKITSLRDYFKKRLQENFSDLIFNSKPEGHYKILSVSFPHIDKADMLLMNLDIAGISASGGSACSSGVDVGSHVLDALQIGTEGTTIRFSFSCLNTKEELDYTIAQLKLCLKPTYTI